MRKLRGLPIQPGEVWTFSWKFFGRFLRLGLLSVPVFVPAIAIGIATTARHPGTNSGTAHLPLGFNVAFVVALLVLDVLGTFVVPALALTVSTVGESIRLGWTITKTLWPINVWYLFAPGLTLSAIAGLLPASVVPIGVTICIGAVSAILGLWFKGATVAFYLRSLPQTPSDGSVHL